MEKVNKTYVECVAVKLTEEEKRKLEEARQILDNMIMALGINGKFRDEALAAEHAINEILNRDYINSFNFI